MGAAQTTSPATSLARSPQEGSTISSTYDPASWYWRVAGDQTHVFSSASMSSVPVDDAAYVAWLELGNGPTAIDTQASLNGVLADTYLARGVNVTSTASPSINGLYAIDDTQQQHIQAVSIFILVNGTFPGGTTTMAWANAAGVPIIIPSTALFQTFASALGSYVFGVIATKRGFRPSFPANTIALP